MAKGDLPQLLASDAKIAVVVQKCPEPWYAVFGAMSLTRPKETFAAGWRTPDRFFRRLFMPQKGPCTKNGF